MRNDSSSDESSSSLRSIETTSHEKQDQTETSTSSFSLARAQGRLVLGSKVLVLSVIFLAAIGCGFATYRVVDQNEAVQFKTQFEAYATEIADVSHQEALNAFNSIAALSASITTFVASSSQKMPFVTIPSFEVHGSLSNSMSRALQVSYAPLIRREERLAWETYTIANQGWINESISSSRDIVIVNAVEAAHQLDGTSVHQEWRPLSPQIYRLENGTAGKMTTDFQGERGVAQWDHAPVWQQAPAPHDATIINYDLLTHPTVARIFHGMWEVMQPVMSEITDLKWLYGGAIRDDVAHPHSFILDPIFPSFGEHHKDDLIGVLVAVIGWDSYFSNILHNNDNDIIVVLHSACGDHCTYRIMGSDAVYVGVGDLHDTYYTDYGKVTPFAEFLRYNHSSLNNHCEYDLHIYPSKELEDRFRTNAPYLYAFVVLMIFVGTALVFLIFDYTVTLRQRVVLASAKRAHAIVSSLFPSNVRDRIFKEAQQKAEDDAEEDLKTKRSFTSTKSQLKDFLGDTKSGDKDQFDTKPIADLFPAATIMFADIVGFTAWSSERQPDQVFTLLEVVYQAFDEIAKRRRVFKVETIGDSYVAVAGLPDPRLDHAVVMARFARDCLEKMNQLTKKLERTLGPDTGDLAMRFGLHSGPVIAGVLRGDKGRFQLFGDTVNTAARMESNGARNRIQCSQETANLLEAAGKMWTRPRETKVKAKGKGELQTYWIDFHGGGADQSKTGTSRSEDTSVSGSDDACDKWVRAGLRPVKTLLDEKLNRLVDWNTDVLARILKQVVARNRTAEKRVSVSNNMTKDLAVRKDGATVLDEVVEVIELPELNVRAVRQMDLHTNVDLDSKVLEQLRHYIYSIATMYNTNPFHNFEHASHVAMSVLKLLSRIVAPTEVLEQSKDQSNKDFVSTLHDHTYGINSDPLTQFAALLAALIHDVDHPGVPNTQLVKEQDELARLYNGKSMAEQNSVDLAWDLLMKPEYFDFRGVLCTSQADMKRFRQIVVNLVMATDVMDADLKELRNSRWTTAFNESAVAAHAKPSVQVNRKATIVLEHLIQASDVAHTMQHWQIYRKWNECLFLEMYKAFRTGRSDKDPCEFWYKGEIGFFDYYVIPLAKKLKDCGVFGVSSDEYLNYAQKNRAEWESRGLEIVASFVEKYNELDYESEGTQDEVVIPKGSSLIKEVKPTSAEVAEQAPSTKASGGSVVTKVEPITVDMEPTTVPDPFPARPTRPYSHKHFI